MKLSPAYCMVCEDTISGIKAAKSAGMQALGITSSLQKEVLMYAGADITAENINVLLDFLPSIKVSTAKKKKSYNLVR